MNRHKVHDEKEDLAKLLGEYRMKRGLTLVGAAKECGLSKQNYWKYEQSVHAERFKELMEKLGYKVDVEMNVTVM